MGSVGAYNANIVIAGGGMVGVSLALQLGAVLPESTSILLIEGFPLPGPAGGTADYHPSFDARSTALSYSSRLIYEQMGVWDALGEWLCPIEQIHVSSKGHFGSTLLQAEDHGWSALGYVVENAWMGRALIEALHQQGRVNTLSPATVDAVEVLEQGVRLSISSEQTLSCDADLLIVADGADSGLCQQLGVVPRTKPYGQHALIANVATDQPHRGIAFERFTDEGPLALLPLLPAGEASNRSALVWTQPPDRAAELIDCPEEKFLEQLQDRFGYRLGRLRAVGERHSYALSLVQAQEQVRQGVVIMGNAAHALHPVAGQGFNLALRDVAELASVLATAGGAFGELATLQAYQQRQAQDQARTISFSDQVPSLFMNRDPLLGLGRDLALSGLDFLPPLKREFVRQAAGVAASGTVSRTVGDG